MYPLQALARTSRRKASPVVESFPRVLADTFREKSTIVEETLTDSSVKKIVHNITSSRCSSDAASCGDEGGSSNSSPEMLLMRPKQHQSRSTKMFVPSQFPAGEALMQHVVFTFSKDPFQKIRYGSC